MFGHITYNGAKSFQAVIRKLFKNIGRKIKFFYQKCENGSLILALLLEVLKKRYSNFIIEIFENLKVDT